MEGFSRVVFMIDLAVFVMVLVAIPCVLVALAFRKTSQGETH